MKRCLPYISPLFFLLGCGTPDDSPPPVKEDASEAVEAAGANQQQITAMQKAIEELQARAEQDVDAVEVQHLLVSFKGAPRMPASVTRSREEAEALTAEIWAEIQEGADFDALIREHTNDSPPGIYPMTRESRRGMVPAFGDTGWRLEVGEYGIAPHDPDASPFGWHIIKRLK